MAGRKRPQAALPDEPPLPDEPRIAGCHRSPCIQRVQLMPEIARAWRLLHSLCQQGA
jgi:hypothetical protein